LNLAFALKSIRYEQAVYGSFPFWHRGYSVLARSAACRSEWLDAMRLAAQKFGERPASVPERDCLFAIRLHRGPWMIVGVFPQGCDDQGRPGALAFHALFVSTWSYRRAGANPFVFGKAFRRVWSLADQDTLLPTGTLSPQGHETRTKNEPDELVQTVVAALKRGQKVIVSSSEPIENLARIVWLMLPGRIRRNASMATWAFENANQFDLVAVPRLAGDMINRCEVVVIQETVVATHDGHKED
jgi:hypothetical protein